MQLVHQGHLVVKGGVFGRVLELEYKAFGSLQSGGGIQLRRSDPISFLVCEGTSQYGSTF